MKNIFKKKIVAVGVIVIIGVVAFFSLSKGDEKSIYDTVIAEKVDMVQEISATGRVEAVQHIDLAFERSGRIDQVNIDIGDTVVAGQILVKLENREGLAELAQAQASVDSAVAALEQYEASLANQKAKLAELLVGTREEEILLYESKVQNADIALVAAKENMIDVMNDAYTRCEDATRSKADQLFNNPRTQSPTLKFTTTNYNLANSVKSSRATLEKTLSSWKIDLDTLSNTSDLELSLNLAKNNLEEVKLFLEQISTVLNNALASQEVLQTTIDAWKVDISTARTSVNTAITNYSATKEKLSTAEISLLITQNELAVKKAGSSPEQITAQEAAIQQAKANITSAHAQIKLQESVEQAVYARLAKNNLRSPITGIVTKQSAKEGAIVGANENIVSVISEGEFEIDALVVEADIIDLEVGDKATLSLDAYGEDVLFEAIVIDIDPAVELIEGVANYRTTLEFVEGVESDERIRVGMTADIDLVTAEREKVISIPQRAVIFKEGKKVVRVLEGGVLREVEVEIGITGGRGQIEIISGIEEGDVIVTAIKK